MKWITIPSALCALLLLLAALCGADETTPVTRQAGEVGKNPKDGATMVWVPAGDFRMGASDDEVAAMLNERTDYKAVMFANERPQHTVNLDGYWIYQYEVTVAQFRKFCKETKREMPEIPAWAKDNFPMVNVTWDDASAYAQWAGATLPTEAQWEKAARGTDARRFPWGNDWQGELCNNYSDNAAIGGGYQGKQAAPVGSYPKSVSPYGAHDMAGNVWEWCQDWYSADYYTYAPKKNPTGPTTGEKRVMRGGSWGSSSKTSRTTTRNSEAPDASYHDDGGFRCAVVPQAEPEKE